MNVLNVFYRFRKNEKMFHWKNHQNIAIYKKGLSIRQKKPCKIIFYFKDSLVIYLIPK